MASFDKGCLDIESLKAFNLALLQKWRWRLVTNSQLLWAKLIKAIHGEEAGLDSRGCKTQAIRAKIVGSINHLHDFGNGSTVRFWKDNWIDTAPLSHRYSRLFRLELQDDCMLSESLVNGSWCWIWRRSVTDGRNGDLLTAMMFELQEVTISAGSDTWTWNIGSIVTFTIGETRKYIDDHLLPTMDLSIR